MRRFLKDHLIPHAGNEYSPHLLQKTAMGAMVVLVLISFAVANIQALIWVNFDWMLSTILPAVVVSETNKERSGDALSSLRRNETLDMAAQLKADHMARNGYFSHYAPDGTSPWYWFNQANYSFVHAGENLAVHFNDSDEVVEAWMSSPTHRANILNGDFTEIGIGVAKGTFEGYDTVFVVQLFGTPAAVAAAPEPSAIETETVTVVTEQVNETPVVANTGEREQVASAEETVVEAPIVVSEPEVVEEIVLEEDTALVADATNTVPETVVSEVVSDSDVALYSELLTTSTAAIPATVSPETASDVKTPFWSFVTQPQFVLQFLYATIGLFVVLVLTLSIMIEIRTQHPVQIAYSVALLLVMSGLYYVHSAVVSGAVIV